MGHTHPLHVNDLPHEQARAVLQVQDRPGHVLEGVALPAERDRTPDAPRLRDGVGHAILGAQLARERREADAALRAHLGRCRPEDVLQRFPVPRGRENLRGQRSGPTIVDYVDRL